MSTWMILDSDHNVYLSTSSAANVITTDGELRQFPTPITVSQVLVQLQLSSSSSSFFICNSDSLYYDENIPALNSTEELQSGQIYFILANSKLNYPLSASDMAALAVKASKAISSMNNDNKTNGKSQISPLMASIQLATEGNTNINMSTNIRKSWGGGLEISRSGSLGKLQRYSTRRPKLLPTRSFQRLTTIHEASDLQAY